MDYDLKDVKGPFDINKLNVGDRIISGDTIYEVMGHEVADKSKVVAKKVDKNDNPIEPPKDTKLKAVIKHVKKDEYKEFIRNYPRRLEVDVCGISDPPSVTHNDFTLGYWPKSVVASTFGYDDNPDGYFYEPEENRIYNIVTNYEELYKQNILDMADVLSKSLEHPIKGNSIHDTTVTNRYENVETLVRILKDYYKKLKEAKDGN